MENLSKAKVILVLMSRESADRPWINFEAGFGKGQKSRVIPLAFNGLSFDTLDYPLKGLQGYYLAALKEILNEISTRMNTPVGEVDLAAAWEEIVDIQSELPAKKLTVELEATLNYPRWCCHFYVINNGNRDVELLEVTVWVPSAILDCPFCPVIDAAILEAHEESIGDVMYTEITYRNYREPMRPERFSKPERLVARLAPGMKSKLQHLFFDVRCPLQEHEFANPIRYKIVGKDMKPVERMISLKDKLVAPKS